MGYMQGAIPELIQAEGATGDDAEGGVFIGEAFLPTAKPRLRRQRDVLGVLESRASPDLISCSTSHEWAGSPQHCPACANWSLVHSLFLAGQLQFALHVHWPIHGLGQGLV